MANIIPSGIDAVSGQAKYVRNNEDSLSTGPNDAQIFWLVNVGGGQGLSIFGAFPVATGNGGNIEIVGGDGGPTSGNGGHLSLGSGSSDNGDAGDITITAGTSTHRLSFQCYHHPLL